MLRALHGDRGWLLRPLSRLVLPCHPLTSLLSVDAKRAGVTHARDGDQPYGTVAIRAPYPRV